MGTVVLVEIMSAWLDWLPFLISSNKCWRHYSPSITARLTSGWRPCCQKYRLLNKSNKLSIIAWAHKAFITNNVSSKIQFCLHKLFRINDSNLTERDWIEKSEMEYNNKRNKIIKINEQVAGTEDKQDWKDGWIYCNKINIYQALSNVIDVNQTTAYHNWSNTPSPPFPTPWREQVAGTEYRQYWKDEWMHCIK
jgi:hypothetical protein